MNVSTLGELQLNQADRERTAMLTFVIDADNNISALRPGEQAPAGEGPEEFKSREELGKLAEGWPAERLVEVWNSVPGVTPVRKFKDRQTAVARIWKAIQSLAAGPQAAQVAPEAT